MKIRCKGNKEVKQVIYKDELVALPLKCMTWVAETKKKDPDIEKDFIGVEEEYINSEDGSKIEGNINMTRNAIIFLPFKTLSDLDGKEKKTEEYLSFMKTILADEYEEQKQGSKFTYIIIGMAVMLVLAATCVTLRKIKGRANSMSYSAYAQREQQKKELEEKQEEIRELLVRRYRDSAEEDGSHRRRSSDGWDTKEPEDMYENDNQDFDEDKKQEGKSRHDEESLYEHYEVPRILFGLQIHEYHDDIVLIKPETEKNGKLIEDEKMGSKEEAKKGDNKNEEQRNTKEPNDEDQKSESGPPSELQLHEYCDDIGLIKTEIEKKENLKKIEKIEIEKSDGKEERNNEGQTNKKEPTDGDQKTETKEDSKLKEGDSLQREKDTDLGRKEQEYERNEFVDSHQASLHSRMLKELHKRFISMKHLHNL